jgi:hypothetical protein
VGAGTGAGLGVGTGAGTGVGGGWFEGLAPFAIVNETVAPDTFPDVSIARTDNSWIPSRNGVVSTDPDQKSVP